MNTWAKGRTSQHAHGVGSADSVQPRIPSAAFGLSFSFLFQPKIRVHSCHRMARYGVSWWGISAFTATI